MNILIIPFLFYNTIVVNTSILSYANDLRHNIALPRLLLGLVILKKFDTIRYYLYIFHQYWIIDIEIIFTVNLKIGTNLQKKAQEGPHNF